MSRICVSALFHRAGILGFWILILFSFSCRQPFTLKGSLDELAVATAELSINPSLATLYIDSSMQFYVTGGVEPYSYTVSEGTGSISEEGLYTAPGSAGSETVTVSDASGESVTSSLTITDEQLDADYFVSAITNTPATAEAATAIGQSFVFDNQGSDNGALSVFWRAYVSDDDELDGGDTLVASGLHDSLDAGASSVSIDIGGNWPSSAGVYNLIVQLTSSDDTDPSNNYSVSDTFTIYSGVSTIDYVVSDLGSNGSFSVNSGSICGETFTLKNLGGADGGTVINWSAYASTDQSVGGDTLIDSGTHAALTAGAASDTISINGFWPETVDSYYLLIELISGGETVTDNNIGSKGIFEVQNPVDYEVTSLTYQSTGEPGLVLSDAGPFSFEIEETGGFDGGQPISYEVFLSLDPVLNESEDTSILEDIISPLDAGTSSGPISFDSAFWPDAGGYYYIIVSIHSNDDSDLMNNLYVTPDRITVAEVYTEDATENSDAGPTGVELTNVSIVTLDGGTLDPGQLLRIEGQMDNNPSQRDTYKIIMGSTTTSIEISITWSTGDDAINFYLWDESNNSQLSASTDSNSEPQASSTPATYTVNPDGTYYIGVEFLAVHLGSPYTITVQGK